MKRKKPVITSADAIDEILSRGVHEVIERAHLRAKLLEGRPLRVKLGIDPTGENIHIGHAAPLLKLRDFQELGHTAVLIIGNATAEIGDTSDKDSERPMLTATDVKKNEKTYLKQLGKLIDLDAAEVHHNADWLNKVKFRDLGNMADQFSVSDFISRDNIKRRLLAGTRVSLREVLYPIMQGYDSVAIKADIELGGIDQRFNLLAGRTLQAYAEQEAQDVVVLRYITDGEGKKMSKSMGNTINLLDTPDDMYAKAMRIPDGAIISHFEIATRVPLKTVQEYSARLNTGENPKNIKTLLAQELVGMYHGKSAADKAHASFDNLFAKGEVSDEAMTEIPVDPGNDLEAIVHEHGLLPSKSEFRRLVEGGGVRDLTTGEKITDPKRKITIPLSLKLGKHKFIKIVIRRKQK
ncbi:MAG: tyrosine--tRNA ligase [Candidatus Pacebacteria bacterium]|nr:tyrosine--tRNA ligase [Candidatus Paceibacterota bacterium]